MKRYFCDHADQGGKSVIRRVASWLDTGGIRWHEDECKSCGRKWRHR